jgi:hypothetical protein
VNLGNRHEAIGNRGWERGERMFFFGSVGEATAEQLGFVFLAVRKYLFSPFDGENERGGTLTRYVGKELGRGACDA